MTMTSFAVETRGLTHCYGSSRALDDLSLQIPTEGIHAIVGANGAGKSTLFRILLGFQTADVGEAWLLGVPSMALSPPDRGRIGYVNDAHSLPDWMRLDAILAMQPRLYPGWNVELLDQVLGYFAVSRAARVRELSRGERAGLNLAIALARKPELLILDEPTLGLDVVAKRAFMEALIHASYSGDATILYCSHQMEEIERLADTLVILDRGRLANASPPEEFTRRVTHWIADMPFKGPDPARVPGLLQMRRHDGLFHYMVVDQGEDFADWLRSEGALSLSCKPANLDQAVSAFLSAGHATPSAESRI
ncbi:ABC transporter [Sphingopyxis sp. LC81]|uniref:ABC transporter ATP-binding protein n=1 Tax=Sphingopyxis sp. LC81 TaxID=1502850 RepID=UPI00050F26E2|nr:ABC transporter ATP-binding protein [Sphingopyxis sp. LC81]KGB53617.1 ABC transporter [Sphingopyxis sp. LC81]